MSKLSQAVKEHLTPNEIIVKTLFGVLDYKILNKSFLHNGALFATNQRVILFSKLFFGYQLESFSYSKINSLEKSKTMFGGSSITIISSGNKATLKGVRDDNFLQVVDFINNSIQNLDTKVDSITDRLQKLETLHKNALIDDNEFVAKKQEILSQL